MPKIHEICAIRDNQRFRQVPFRIVIPHYITDLLNLQFLFTVPSEDFHFCDDLRLGLHQLIKDGRERLPAEKPFKETLSDMGRHPKT